MKSLNSQLSITNLTRETLEIDIQNRRDITDEEYKQIVALIQSLKPEDINLDWLVETTEKFCKDRAIHNAVMDGIQILERKDTRRTMKRYQKY